MKIPRRLKEMVSPHKNISVEQEKRGFALIKADNSKMLVNPGQVVSLEQWEQLRRDISKFARA